MREQARDWMDADEERRRELRRWMALSALGHALLLAVLIWAPRPSAQAALPGAVMVDLVAMVVPAGEPAKPSRAAPPPARTAPATPPPPEPAPAKPEPAAPPPAPTREAVLPKTPQREPDKPKPNPKPEPKPEPEVAKAKPEPKPSPPQPPPAAKKPAPEYDDVLASLRAERGETRPERAERPAAQSVPAGTAGAAGPASVAVTPEVASWLRAARMAVRQAWALPAGFRKQPLETHVTVELDAEGNVLAEPKVTQRSGNPWYDESVVRAIQKASPLPRPPEAGAWPFVFRPEDLG